MVHLEGELTAGWQVPVQLRPVAADLHLIGAAYVWQMTLIEQETNSPSPFA